MAPCAAKLWLNLDDASYFCRIWHDGMYLAPSAHTAGASLLKRPLVLPSDFFLFLRCEIVLDVKCLSNLLGCLALDHVRNSLASQIQQILDIQVVGSLFTSQTPISVPTFLTYPVSTVHPRSLERCISETSIAAQSCNLTGNILQHRIPCPVGRYNAGCPKGRETYAFSILYNMLSVDA